MGSIAVHEVVMFLPKLVVMYRIVYTNKMVLDKIDRNWGPDTFLNTKIGHIDFTTWGDKIFADT